MLMIHDTTGTQTDSVAPLSRKKLKRLMWRNPSLTTRNLQETFGRRIGLKLFSKVKQIGDNGHVPVGAAIGEEK